MTIVLLPQALTSMLPAVVSQLVVIVKDTALGGILVGYVELRRAANTSASDYGNLLPTYVVVAVIYIVINLALGYLSTVPGAQAAHPPRRRPGGRIDPAAQTDLLAARQEIEVLDVPGVDEIDGRRPQPRRPADPSPARRWRGSSAPGHSDVCGTDTCRRRPDADRVAAAGRRLAAGRSPHASSASGRGPAARAIRRYAGATGGSRAVIAPCAAMPAESNEPERERRRGAARIGGQRAISVARDSRMTVTRT